MQSDKKIDDIAFERRITFEHTFGNGDFFEDGMIRSLDAMCDLMSVFLGEEHAEAGFNYMVSEAFQKGSSDAGWREILDEDFGLIYSETHLGGLVHDLTAYADYGIVLTVARDAGQRRDVLAGQVEMAGKLLSLLPTDQWKLEGEHLLTVLRKAIARWKVDNGEPIDVTELAILSGRALQTIKNKLAGEYKEINGSQNRIEAAEAKSWLDAQQDFYGSIWQLQDDSDLVVEFDKGMGEVLFVPVAKDGTPFDPNAQKGGQYLIDAEGSEREFDNFHEALSELQKMHVPQWRRPTPEGRWTRVRGVSWKRIALEDLCSAAE